MSTISNAGSMRNEMVSFKEDKAQVVEYTPPEWKDKKRRIIQPVRKVDLKIAWQIHAKELKKQAAADEETRPIMRLIYRSRCDHLWEMILWLKMVQLYHFENDIARIRTAKPLRCLVPLDDPDSSMAAWAVSQFLKVLVLVSVVLSMLATTQEPLVDVSTSAVLETLGSPPSLTRSGRDQETCFDVIFVMEFLCRCISSPSKRIYVQDPFNWCDMLAALGLPLRASVGFVLQPLSSLEAPTVQQVLLLLFLPIFRFLKLLRYFESFHLLVDAGKNSIAALPVLFYTMAVITLLSSSAIYLVESRDNIPSLPHSIWLALVTMTTVGYGDYAPKSTGGYFVVATLTGVSVLFLALPVGIIGHVFTACWESRAQVLLMNRVRKCLVKWGYTIKDLKILVEYVDADGDGTLNLPEFIELIRQMRIGLTSETGRFFGGGPELQECDLKRPASQILDLKRIDRTAVDLFMLFDDDHSGLVDYNEFLRHIFPDQYEAIQRWEQVRNSVFSNGSKHQQDAILTDLGYPRSIEYSSQFLQGPYGNLKQSHSVTSGLQGFASMESDTAELSGGAAGSSQRGMVEAHTGQTEAPTRRHVPAERPAHHLDLCVAAAAGLWHRDMGLTHWLTEFAGQLVHDLADGHDAAWRASNRPEMRGEAVEIMSLETIC
eukprot:s2406_g2.t1